MMQFFDAELIPHPSILRPKPCERWHFFHQQSHQQRRPWRSIHEFNELTWHGWYGMLGHWQSLDTFEPIMPIYLYLVVFHLSYTWGMEGSRDYLRDLRGCFVIIFTQMGRFSITGVIHIHSCVHSIFVVVTAVRYWRTSFFCVVCFCHCHFQVPTAALLQYFTAGQPTAERCGEAKKQEEPTFKHRTWQLRHYPAAHPWMSKSL